MDSLPEADDIVERFEKYIFDFDFSDYNGFNVQSEGINPIFQAIKENDIKGLGELLKSANDSCSPIFKIDGTPILLLAVVSGNIDAVRSIIERGCEIRDTDWNGNTALHMAVWNRRTPYFYRTRWSRNESACKGCELKLHRPDLVDILLKSFSDPIMAFENIFVDANENGVTPFLRSCAAGCDEITFKFLSILDKMKPKFLTSEIFSDDQGNNIFHYILDSSTYNMTFSRPETVKALLEKISWSKKLIKEKNCMDISPLEMFIGRDLPDWTQIRDLAKILLKHGADPDLVNISGETFLCTAIAIKNTQLMEILLRSGCDPDFHGPGTLSPLSLALNRSKKDSEKPNMEIIELLLSFGVSLQKELYLFEPEERSLEHDSPEYAHLCDSQNIDPEILEKLKNLRRSNTLISLKRLCRKAVRFYLKPNADEVIPSLSVLPDSVKEYLMVGKEMALIK